MESATKASKFIKLSNEQLKDIIQWDIKTWSKALRFWEEKSEGFNGKKVLAIGERGGGLSLYFALNGATVICTDFNSFPESTGELHKKYGVENQISYLEGVDASNLAQFENEQFDIVVFKSVLGALSTKVKQQASFSEFHRVLKNGGEVIFAENLEGAALHRFFRKKFIRWASYWRYFQYKGDQDFYQQFAQKEFTAVGFLSGFGRSERQRSFLAAVDSILAPITPKSWKTVLIGVLKKGN